MITNSNTPGGNEGADMAHNDPSTYGDDTLGENTGDSALDIQAKADGAIQPQKKPTDDNDPRIETVIPDNDN
jgi:hypothetical protein